MNIILWENIFPIGYRTKAIWTKHEQQVSDSVIKATNNKGEAVRQ